MTADQPLTDSDIQHWIGRVNYSTGAVATAFNYGEAQVFDDMVRPVLTPDTQDKARTPTHRESNDDILLLMITCEPTGSESLALRFLNPVATPPVL